MKRLILIFVILFSVSVWGNYQNNPSFYQPANPNPKALTSYKQGSGLSGASIFGDFKNLSENPYGINIFAGGLSLGYLKEDYINYFSVGYGLSLGNSTFGVKYSTDFKERGNDHLDLGLLLVYRYLNVGFNIYNVNTKWKSWKDAQKSLGATGFLFGRKLFVSTYGEFTNLDEDLYLTNSVGYNFSRNLMLEAYLNYNIDNFKDTKKIGLEASAQLTTNARADIGLSYIEENDDYNAKASLVWFNQQEPTKKLSLKKYAVIKFPSKFVDKENMFNESYTYHSFYNKLLTLSTSPSIRGIVIDIPSSIREGLGVVENFRALFENIKKNGKEVYAYLESGGAKEFFLASVADSLFLNPSSYNVIRNPYLETMYYKGLLDKIGVKFEYIRYAEYKSAIEPYAMDSMTTFARANKQELIDDMIKNVANSKINFQQLTQKVMITPKEMVDSGFVDDTLYWDQVVAKISNKGLLTPFEKIDYREDLDYSGGKIAIVNFKGSIIPGNSANTIWGGSYVGSESFRKLMAMLEANSSVRGIIVKINSPGGSAVASDVMYHSLKKIKKPVYAYIENVGASGGYYTACGSDKIYSSPSAIVGSIGIYAGKVDANGLFNKLNLRNEKVMSGPRDDIYSTTKTWEKDDYDILNTHLKYYYDRFLTVVATSRKMAIDSTENLAGGRVYCGSRAQKLGLVDEVSDLSKVINDMKKEIKVHNLEVAFVAPTSLVSKLVNSVIPNLRINESVSLIESLQQEQIYMIEPNLSIE